MREFIRASADTPTDWALIRGPNLPDCTLPVLLVGNDRQVMGDLANGRLSKTVGTATLLLSVVVSATALPLLVLTRAGSS